MPLSNTTINNAPLLLELLETLKIMVTMFRKSYAYYTIIPTLIGNINNRPLKNNPYIVMGGEVKP